MARIRKKIRKPSALSAGRNFSLISNRKLRDLYTAMLKCRMLEERVGTAGKTLRQRNGRELPPRREAVTAGIALDLRPDDTVFSAAPDPLAAFVKGVPLESIVRTHRRPLASGDAPEPCAGHGILRGNSAAGTMAAGAAFAHKLTKRGNVSVVFYSGSEAEDPWRETVDFAAAHRLPVIFVRVAGLPDKTAAAGQPRTAERRRKAPAPPVIPVDRDDVVAVYRVAHEAIAHARNGNGPTLIDCVPLPGQHGAAPDAIRNMEAYLAGKGLHAEQTRAAVTAEFARALQAAAASVRRAAGTVKSRSRKRR
jgi:pyruvate dehydrogenase E1 component alpha subunit